MPLRTVCAVALMFAAVQAEGGRRAVLVGVNDYTASRLAPSQEAPAPGRDWPNLAGAVNDVMAMRELLILLYGFEPGDIVTIIDQSATRTAILMALHQHLVVPAAKDDVVLFYFAGHGSQVVNSRSDEPDGLDESLVPADSRRGARDIRDKELRVLFNRILDRGARLTVILDSCHSASGARGLPGGAQARGVAPDLRDIGDGATAPRPENRGALVLSATEEFDLAHETRGEDKQIHGAFSWALFNAMRHAAGDEPAEETFLRARARMRTATPFQQPVMAGNAEARLAPFLGTRAVRRESRPAIIIERVWSDGTVALHGGWAHGLNIGTELRHGDTRFVITTIHGLGRSEARVIAGRPAAGAKLEVARWAPPRERPLRVWMARASGDMTAKARALRAEATRRGVRWIEDPTEVAPAPLLRPPDLDMAMIPKGASVFVRFPAPVIDIEAEGIEIVPRAEEADYILAGRYANDRIEYAWIRPHTNSGDAKRTGLPARTRWTTSKAVLEDAVRRLRRIHGWHQLESPPRWPSPYRLAIHHDGTPVTGDTLIAGRTYTISLRAVAADAIEPRYVYVFVIDSAGTGILLFPQSGSVDNRISAPRDLTRVEIAPPYGLDTWFLLTTDEPLADPWLLEWDGVRSGRLMPSAWSIEKTVFESVPLHSAQ